MGFCPGCFIYELYTATLYRIYMYIRAYISTHTNALLCGKQASIYSVCILIFICHPYTPISSLLSLQSRIFIYLDFYLLFFLTACSYVYKPTKEERLCTNIHIYNKYRKCSYSHTQPYTYCIQLKYFILYSLGYL